MAGEQEGLLRDIAKDEASVPFDLERGPVWRAALITLGAEEHVLLLTLHHVVCDAWTTSLLARELTALYQAWRDGLNSGLEEPSVQYADYAVWQREWLQGSVMEQQLSYWRRQLKGALVLELPADRPRAPVPRYRGEVVPFALSAEMTRQLREISQREGVTLFMVLLAGFQLVLGRYAGQDDVVVGTDVANRNWLGTENLIGFFVNQFALRTDLSGNPNLKELLRRVRETTLGAYDHQDLPFDKLVEELAPDRSLTTSPFFRVKLVLQNAPTEELRVPGLGINRFATDHGIAKRDFTLFLTESDNGVIGGAEYAVHLYERSTIERLLEHLRIALEAMIANDNQWIMDLNLPNEIQELGMLQDLELQAFSMARRKAIPQER
jgi:hypothetical protein